MLLFCDFFITFFFFENDVNVASKSNKQKTGSISQRHGSADPDPYQKFMDPQYWLRV